MIAKGPSILCHVLLAAVVSVSLLQKCSAFTSALTSAPFKSCLYSGAFGSRLTSIESRVGSLEKRLDQIPDEVQERMESWAKQQDEKLSVEFRRIGSMIDNSGGNDVYVTPAPPSTPPPQVEAMKCRNTSPKRSGRGMGGYLDSLNP